MDDFHIHSTYSDGLDSIDNLIQKTRGFTIFSITDHNNIEASKKIKRENFITGVELSTYFSGDEYHILGYNFDANNKEITVTVTDNGCGIAPEHQKKIFDRFYRVENNTHTIKGTGLGLNLVKTTIEKHHNGRVFVHSEVGKGATFGFVLPVITVEEYSMK